MTQNAAISRSATITRGERRNDVSCAIARPSPIRSSLNLLRADYVFTFRFSRFSTLATLLSRRPFGPLR